MLKKLVLFATLLVIAVARPQAHVSMTKNVVANMNEDSFDEQNVMADRSDTAAEVIEGEAEETDGVVAEDEGNDDIVAGDELVEEHEEAKQEADIEEDSMDAVTYEKSYILCKTLKRLRQKYATQCIDMMAAYNSEDGTVFYASSIKCKILKKVIRKLEKKLVDC